MFPFFPTTNRRCALSEEFKDRLILKMAEGGTTRSDQHLCLSCSYGFVRRGVNASQDMQVCTQFSSRPELGVIKGPVAACSEYYPKHLPTLRDLNEIAWQITTSKNGKAVGFITPDERRKQRMSHDD